MTFTRGFRKQASLGSDFITAGIAAGVGIGGMYAAYKASQFVDKNMIQNKHEHVDARKLFHSMKEGLPKDTTLMTSTELHNKVKAARTADEMNFWQLMRAHSEGNAAAIPADATKGFLFELGQKIPLALKIPDEIKGRNVIISDDKVHPAILAHEVGHIIDFDITEKGGIPTKLKNALSLPFRAERAAWDLAPKKGIHPARMEEIRKGALSTYYGSLGYPLLGGALGALGAGGAYLLAKKLRGAPK